MRTGLVEWRESHWSLHGAPVARNVAAGRSNSGAAGTSSPVARCRPRPFEVTLPSTCRVFGHMFFVARVFTDLALDKLDFKLGVSRTLALSQPSVPFAYKENKN